MYDVSHGIGVTNVVGAGAGGVSLVRYVVLHRSYARRLDADKEQEQAASQPHAVQDDLNVVARAAIVENVR